MIIIIVKTNKLPEARENKRDQFAVGFRFASDWFKRRASFLDQSIRSIQITSTPGLRLVFSSIGRKSFYLYCAVMCVVNLMQGSASLLMYEGFVQSLW